MISPLTLSTCYEKFARTCLRIDRHNLALKIQHFEGKLQSSSKKNITPMPSACLFMCMFIQHFSQTCGAAKSYFGCTSHGRMKKPIHDITAISTDRLIWSPFIAPVLVTIHCTSSPLHNCINQEQTLNSRSFPCRPLGLVPRHC